MSANRSALIVDDERDIRELLVLTLGRMGLQVDTAANLTEARELLASDNPMLHPELLEREIAKLQAQEAAV